jgi:glutathione S-transferase
MRLIGKLDSPYVRRVAISMNLLGVRFEHRPISVFGGFDEFKQINPVVKAPTLVCDDGELLMDSTLILDYLETMAAPARTLLPVAIDERKHTLRVLGLALAACEKTVQIVYERDFRPPEKQHEPWLTRVGGQLLAAYSALESELRRCPLSARSDSINQAGVTCAVAWRFTQMMLPAIVSAAEYPAIQAYAEQAEQLTEFRAAPPT